MNRVESAFSDNLLTVHCGDALEVLKTLPDESVQCCVTSPPYWGLRDYGVDGQIGIEKTPQEFIAKLVALFSEVRRALKKDGTLWVNMGDSYNGSGKGGNPSDSPHQLQRSNTGSWGGIKNRNGWDGLKPKDLCGIPWRLAFALQADGWWLRSDIIWAKPNPMPESVTDRPTKAHEYIFLLTKAERYFYDADAIREPHETEGEISTPENKRGGWRPCTTDDDIVGGKIENGRLAREAGKFPRLLHPFGRNKRTVWSIGSAPYPEAHFATYPPDLIKPCILAGTKPSDVVLDPFGGSGTTGQVAIELGRKAILIELNPQYVELIKKRTFTTPGLGL
jgi:DNA modification methylase